ncbi:hypothetical protein LR48_Vigan07g154200 [Vigna angularis]|uniref:Uncharacterized protein n=1 Tax=Phaseolus angularis TaxID=3914 RepID=A0A0L9UYH9_PHAAN|nr:hypothetical protein LR48_Vigan07g154200 [Vigna angularis]
MTVGELTLDLSAEVRKSRLSAIGFLQNEGLRFYCPYHRWTRRVIYSPSLDLLTTKGDDLSLKPLLEAINREGVHLFLSPPSFPFLHQTSLLTKVIMSSSTWFTDELTSEGRGYVDDISESPLSVRSSILGSDEDNSRSENVFDEIILNVDNSLEWSGINLPSLVKGYQWAPHEAKTDMTPEELDIIDQIDQLPRRTSSRKLIGLLGSDTLRARVFDIFGRMEKHQAFMHMMARKKDLEKSGEGTSSPSKIVTHKTLFQGVNSTLKISNTEKPSPAPTKPSSAGIPKGDVKRKLSHDKSLPLNKKKKITGPLLSRPLDPLVHVAERLQYNLKQMSPDEALDMAYELTARASICMNYVAGSAKCLLVEELDTDSRVKATIALTQAQDDLHQLKRTNDDLKLDLQKDTSQNQALIKEKDALVAARDKLAAENLSLGDEICNERLTSFEQGIAQCHYFFKTPLNHAGFDVMKVLVDGQLVPMSILDANDPTATTDAPLSTSQAGIEEALNVTSATENTAA